MVGQNPPSPIPPSNPSVSNPFRSSPGQIIFYLETNKAVFPRDRYTESTMFPFICSLVTVFSGSHMVRTLVSNKRYTSIDPTIYSYNRLCLALERPIWSLRNTLYQYCICTSPKGVGIHFGMLQ